MSSPVVSIPGVGNVSFPSSMSQDDINTAAHRLYTGAASNQISANPPSVQPPTPSDLQGPNQPPSTLKAGGAASDLLQGVGEGAIDTVGTIGKAITDPIVKQFASSDAMAASDQNLKALTTPDNTAQSVGYGAESLAEALTGDEAIKGMALGDRLLHVGKVAEAYDKAGPFARKAIETALNAARAGAVTGGETFAKTGDVNESAKAAAEGAVASPLIEGAIAGTGKAAGAVSDLWGTVTGKAIQQDLQSGIRSVLSDAADTAEVDKPTTTSIRKSAASLAENVEYKAKGIFQTIDDATDGEATNLQQKIKNVDFKLRDVAGTNDVEEARLTNQKTALENRFDAVLDKAVREGVDQDTIDAAKQTWKQSSALRDLDTQLKASTAGNVKNAPEVVDPNKLVPRLQKLADSGRLEEALGPHAEDLLQKAYDSQKTAGQRSTAVKAVKHVAGVAGIGTVGGALAHTLAGNILNK
jgi:hypothetical protein